MLFTKMLGSIMIFLLTKEKAFSFLLKGSFLLLTKRNNIFLFKARKDTVRTHKNRVRPTKKTCAWAHGVPGSTKTLKRLNDEKMNERKKASFSPSTKKMFF